jgi:hypothetical protein
MGERSDAQWCFWAGIVPPVETNPAQIDVWHWDNIEIA